MPYLIAVKQRKVLQEEDAGSTALIKLIGQKGSIRLTKPKMTTQVCVPFG